MSYPILFPASATAFASQGLGVLSDAISCIVTEERNGMYELQMQYPITGIHFSEIEQRSIILAKPNYTDDPQAFRIYKITKALGGICTIYAQHISYDLSGYEIEGGLSASGLTEAVQLLSQYSGAFTVSTTKTGSAIFKTDVPASVRSWLGGKEGSLLDLYGGEWHWDGYNCVLSTARGTNRGVTIRYGKNLTALEQEAECSNLYSTVRAYYSNQETMVSGDLVPTGITIDTARILFVDATTDFSEAPTSARLTSYAQEYIQKHNLTAPTVNLTLDFVQMQGLSERVDLCDTVTIQFEQLGVSATAKCIKTEWDVLEDRYTRTEFGDARSSLSKTIVQNVADTQSEMLNMRNSIAQTKSDLELSIDRASSLITGNSGGYVVIHDSDNDGKPDEILIMDTDDITTAVKVWRWNKNGLGYSSTGYSGSYGTAITADGQIVANFITTGTLNANLLKTGVIQGQTGNSYWNLVTGELHIEGGSTVDKSKIFITEPTVPYYVGDLWVTGQESGSGIVGYAIAGEAIVGNDLVPTQGGQIMACNYARTTGSFNANDWELITNYIDRSELDILQQRMSSVEFNVSQQDAKIDMKASSAEVTELGNRMTYAELSIDGMSGEISSKVSTTDYTGATIASLINQSASTVLIQAEHINLTGKVTMTALATDVTNSISTAQSTATNAASVANTAQRSASSANAQAQLVYISKASGTTSVTAPSSWVSNTTGNQNTWTIKRPVYNSSYPVLFVATQAKTVGGTVTCTTPQIDQTTTVIDGGHITTGTIDASVVNVTNIKAGNITSGTINAARIGANSIAVSKLTGSISNSGWVLNLTDGTFTIGNISANNISSGTLTLGGANNVNGVLVVKNSSNVTTVTLNQNGITATAGTIGGYKIGQYTLTGGSGSNAVGICSTVNQGYAFWAGNATSGSAPFRVGHDGTIYSTKGYIGGYTVDDHKLTGGSGSTAVGMSSTAGDGWAFWAGATSGDSAPFRVGHGGNVICSDLTVTGGSINLAGTRIDANGYLYSTNSALAGNFYGYAELGNGSSFSGYSSGSFSGSSSGSFSGTGTLGSGSTLTSYSSGNIIYMSYGGYTAWLSAVGMQASGDGSTGQFFSDGAHVISSDKRLKEDIVTLEDDATEFIYSLNPVKYVLKGDSQRRRHHGFIAQEMQKVISDKKWHIVRTMETEDSEYLGISYTELIADMVATIQSLNERIKILERRA